MTDPEYMLRILFFLLFFCLPEYGEAGAWARDKGNTFVALSFSQELQSKDIRQQIYLEYGLTPTLTFGLKASNKRETKVFVRKTLTSGPNLVWAGSLGVVTNRDAAATPLVTTGVHVGKSYETRAGSGWAAVDLETAMTFGGALDHLEVSSVLGLNVTNLWKLMLNADYYKDRTGQYFKLTPSVARELSGHTYLQLGVTQTVLGGSETRPEISVWFDF